MISVLIDHDPEATSLNGPATYYDFGDSYCTNPFCSSCQHRMACIYCDFNLLTQSASGLVLESEASVRRYLEEVPLTPDEKAILEQDVEKIEQALKKIPPQTQRLKRAALWDKADGAISNACSGDGRSAEAHATVTGN